MEKNALKLGRVSNETALSILGEAKYKNGGGWGKVGDEDVYLCTGAHKDGLRDLIGTSSWAIKQIGRSF